MSYWKETWIRAKECLVLIPFIVLPLLCWGVAKGSEIEKETQGDYFLPDTTKAVETPPQETIVEEKEEEGGNFVIIPRGTVYNPRKDQCWGDPWKAYTGRIDSVKLENKQIRWVALSPDLLKKIPMHSKIRVHDPDKAINGIWYVKDICGTKETIDFLYAYRVLHVGLWYDIKVEILREGK